VDESWTLIELVNRAAAHIAALPAPTNGQIRAVPDERTIRYYVTLGLLDRPAAMRGRTALYNRRHLAQVVAIKRLQTAGRSLAEIQAMWPTLDDATLARMTGVVLAGHPRSAARPPARTEFWKREPARDATEAVAPPVSPTDPNAPPPRPTPQPARPEPSPAREGGGAPRSAAAERVAEDAVEARPGSAEAGSDASSASTARPGSAEARSDAQPIDEESAPLLTELARRRRTSMLEDKEP
jgi:DNA-binding transcriptional MerR regulator